ncbi:DOPA 4,5-dioxygenase family protein [Vibrio mangrovi]|nr:DOPA 4,5-dioxygenase family protein [Vibrio mangrovi]MDW6004802.1 DOPA 4,5-dioxygenase family protein [Vibrio mangrovi]
MKNPPRPQNRHAAYHAHVYFDSSTLGFATELCHTAGEKFSLKVGRVHQRLVGPHTKWSCQIRFGHADFDHLIPWLDKHRGDLSVLIHADTGNDLEDHTKYAYWLGDAVELNLSVLH